MQMMVKFASFLKSTGAAANIVILSFAAFLGAAHSASEKAGDGDVREVSSSPLSNLSATIVEQYPSVRALAVAQGNCVVFDYYRKDIGSETQSPVFSDADPEGLSVLCRPLVGKSGGGSGERRKR